MELQEKVLSRLIFRNKIFESSGQPFEDLFISIMSYAEKKFTPIETLGNNTEDRKKYAYIANTGTFYQVYAPEYISKCDVLKKIRKGFNYLLSKWTSVNNFYFVINDKYKGIDTDVFNIMQQIKQDYNLDKAEILIAKDLENIVFEKLKDDEIITVIGWNVSKLF